LNFFSFIEDFAQEYSFNETVYTHVNKQQVIVNKKHFQANDLLNNTQNLRESFRD